MAHRVISLPRSNPVAFRPKADINKLGWSQFVGRMSVSVTRHFVENTPRSVGLVDGAIRFAIAPLRART